MRRTYFIALLTCIVFLLYAPALTHTRSPIDDSFLVFNNDLITKSGIDSYVGMFTTYDPELYIPLTLLTYKAEYILFQDWYLPYHLTNIVLHIANTIFVFFFLGFLFRKSQYSLAVAFVGSLFWGIHPINAESALWISSRKDLVSTFFGLISMLLYYKYYLTKCKAYFRWSIATFTLGLLAKVSVFPLPLLLILIDFYEDGPRGWAMVRDKGWYFGLALFFLCIGLIGKYLSVYSVSYMTTAFYALHSIIGYGERFLFPFDFSVVYPYAGEGTFLSFDGLTGIAIIACLLTIALASKKHFPIVFFGLFFAAFSLLPNLSNFSRMEYHLLYLGSDRYVYLASIGLIALVSAGYLYLRERVQTTDKFIALHLLVAIVIGFFGFQTVQYMETWQTEDSQMAHWLERNPNDVLVQYIHAQMLMKKGQYRDAAIQLEAILLEKYEYVAVHYTLSYAYFLTQRPELALETVENALELNETHDDALELKERILNHMK